MKPVLLFFFVVFCTLNMHAQQLCDTAVVTVDTAVFKAMLEKHDGVLLDVRTPEEWKTGYIKNAINIDYRAADFQQRVNKLDKSKTYYIYCEIGTRSENAALYMQQQGFCHMVVLKRGLHLWKEAGYPLVVPKSGK